YPIGAEQSSSVAGGALHSSGWTAGIVRYFLLPWKVLAHSGWYFESVLPHPLGVLLILFAPGWWLVKRKVSLVERACLFFAAVYLLCWFWSPQVSNLRYAVTPLLLVLLFTTARSFNGGRRSLDGGTPSPL